MRHDVMTDAIPNRCERCYETDVVLSMSKFNTDMICIECDDKERKHPKYKDAVKAEHKAICNGNYNFSGIGKPSDL